MTAEHSLHLWYDESSGEVQGNYRVVVGNLSRAVSRFELALSFTSDCGVIVEVGRDENGDRLWGRDAKLTFEELEGRSGSDVETESDNLKVRVLKPGSAVGELRVSAVADVYRLRYARERCVRQIERSRKIEVTQWPSR